MKNKVLKIGISWYYVDKTPHYMKGLKNMLFAFQIFVNAIF